MKNEQLIHEALDAFWEVVAKRFPEATTGDLCPLTALAFDQAAEAAVTQWIGKNVPSQPAESDAL
jgi:hypothetical protein